MILKVYLYLRGGEAEREGGTERSEAGSMLTAESQMRGSNPQTMRS